MNSTSNKFPNRDLNPDSDLNFFLIRRTKNADGKTLSASATITNIVSKNTSLRIRK